MSNTHQTLAPSFVEAKQRELSELREAISGEAIGEDRLNAVPEATNTLREQEDAERKR